VKIFWLAPLACFAPAAWSQEVRGVFIEGVIPFGEGWQGFLKIGFLAKALLTLILSTVLGAIIGIPVVEYGTFVGFVLIYLMVGRHIPVMVLAMTLAFATPARGEPEWRFGGVDRLVAVADVHGAYGAFETILSRAGLIDATRNWTGAGTHLVIVGDVLDRGPDSRRALADRLEHLSHPIPDLVAWPSLAFQPIGHVLFDRQVRE
jgi:hypothetical protein